MAFEFATAGRIVFGPGSRKKTPEIVRALGARVLVVGGTRGDEGAALAEELKAVGMKATIASVTGEPTVESVLALVHIAADFGADVVVAMGGGSAIDSGKAVAALVANPGDPFDHLEVVGRGKPLAFPPLPVVALPTTAGTGSEVTRNAVLGVPEQRVKVSLRSPLMLPRVAIIDPELSATMPPEVTASTGMDALTQVIEPYVSIRANPLTDGLCREGITRAAGSLARAYRDGSDVAAREDMAAASLLGGMALANAGLGAVHGFAAPIGGMFPAPHGAVCARLLPLVMAANIRALREREPDSPALERYRRVAKLLTGDTHAAAEDGVEWTVRLAEELQINSLADYGLTAADIPVVVEKTLVASSTQANPIKLTADELAAVLAAAI